MGTLDLTVQILDLSPKATRTDLNTFFSYCGTVDNIQLRRNEDQSQVAFVTFRQPYAQQTALLLSGAPIADQPIRVLHMQNIVAPPNSEKINNETQSNKKQDLPPPPQSQPPAWKGGETLNRDKVELVEKNKLLEEERTPLVQRGLPIIPTSKQKGGRVEAVIMNNKCLSAGALWLSGVLDKAAKRAAVLGNNSKRINPNSRKQK